MNNAAFGKPMEIVKKHRHSLSQQKEEETILYPVLNYPPTKFFTQNLLAVETKTKIQRYVWINLSV